MSLNTYPDASSEKPAKRRNSRKGRMKQIAISIPNDLLKQVDEAAKQDYTSRSDIIRIALLWYLRPQGRDLAKLSPEEIYKILNNRRMRAYFNKIKKDLDYLE